MNTKHTPGPWRIGVRQPNSDKFIYGANGEEVANCDRLMNFPHENQANARLIAKAPELLIAAIAYRNHLKTAASTEGEVRTYEHLCDLIAQATAD